jgi:hypothetical protein
MNTTRKFIRETLELWSSEKAQLEYQDNVPIADVPSELFCWWGDHFYDPTLYSSEEDYSKDSFTSGEMILLKEFDVVLNEAVENTPDTLPHISEFIKTDEWKKVNSKAIEVLNKIFIW